MSRNASARSRWLTALCLTLLSVCAYGDPARRIDVPAGDLSAALEQLAKQANVNLVFSTAELRGLKTAGVSGEMTVREAVERLLQGTQMRLRMDAATGAMLISGTGKTTRVQGQTGVAVRLSEAHAADSPAPLPPLSDDDLQEFDTRSIPEILVLGSRSLNMDIERTVDDIQPYVTFDHITIQKSGARNIEDLLRDRLTQGNSFQTSAQTEGGGNTSAFDLRGLGTDETLILIDGHRVAGAHGGVQPDLNSIPLSAIERIEVLATTASGIYGGGATGGVINVVMRRDYSGLETRLSYENSFDGGGATRRVEVAGGFNLGDRTDVMLIGSYTDGSVLTIGDRDYMQRGIERILANNPSSLQPGFSPPLGRTTNICSGTELFPGFAFCNGAPLTLDGGTVLDDSFTSVPYGYAGVASDGGAALAQRAGQYNFDLADTAQYSGGARRAVINEPTVKTLRATVRHTFTDSIDAFVDVAGSRNSGVFPSTFASGTMTLAGDAPNNPFQETISVTTPVVGSFEGEQTDDDLRAVAGMIFRLPAAWQGEVDYTWDRTRYTPINARGVDFTQAAVAVGNGITPSGQPFDVFQDTSDAPLDFLPYLGAPLVVSETQVVMQDTTVRFAGPIGWGLPGGEPTLTLLLEHRKEDFGDQTISDPTFMFINRGGATATDSVYLEASVPLLAQRNRVPGAQRVDLQLAVRRDDYSLRAANTSISFGGGPPQPLVTQDLDFDSIDPTVGLRYQPFEDLTLRASYGTGFLPPPLPSIVPGPTLAGDGISFGGLTDPRRGNEPVGPFTYQTGGNPDLKPEQSESHALGLILKPRVLPGLELRLDWNRIRKFDNITNFGIGQGVINDEEQIPGIVLRGPPDAGFDVGPIIGFAPGIRNVSTQLIEAYDISTRYRMETAELGAFTFLAAATRLDRHVSKVISTAPELDRLETSSALRWRAHGSLDWDYGGWNARWGTRFIDSYCIEADCTQTFLGVLQGSPRVPSQIYHDVAVAYTFPAQGGWPMLANAEIRFGAKNVFNEKPPVDVASVPYYSPFGDPRAGTYYVSLRKDVF